MTPEQFSHNLQEVFSELQTSGVDINAGVYRKLMALYSAYKEAARVRDLAIDKNVQMFTELRDVKEEFLQTSRILAEVTQLSKKEQE